MDVDAINGLATPFAPILNHIQSKDGDNGNDDLFGRSLEFGAASEMPDDNASYVFS